MSILLRRITLAALMAVLVGGTLTLPSASTASPVAHASKCKKAKKGKKKKKCKRGHQSGNALPGQATHPNATPPNQTTPTVGDVALASNPVLAGSSTTGQVTVSGPAPSGGQTVNLQSSDSSRVSVPSTVAVAAGQTTANFAVTTTAGSNVTVTLTASIGTSNDNAQLTVVSAPSVASVSLQRQCFAPGNFSANRVTLDVPAPADTPVSLASDDASAFSVAPGFTTVPTGSKTAFFGALAGSPASPVTVTVTASLGSSSAQDSALVSASTPTPAVSAVSVQPGSVTSGESAVGTVTLGCEGVPGGTVVNLSVDLPGVTVPATVTVPQDGRSATFPITTAGTAVGTATITADTGTGGPQQTTLAVNSLGT